MKLEDLVKRTDELIKMGQVALSTATPRDHMSGFFVPAAYFAEFRSAALSFLERTFGTNSTLYKEFDSSVRDTSSYYTERGTGILKAARTELAGGWVFTTKGLVSAEVFTDFIEMAEHFLTEKYKDAAAVITGSVLEEHLRQLCQKNSVPLTFNRPDGSTGHKRADAMNADLVRAGVYNQLEQKNVTSWLGYRNSAAHGKYADYDNQQVALMLRGVTEFVARNPP